jgi:hypothetical protein
MAGDGGIRPGWVKLNQLGELLGRLDQRKDPPSILDLGGHLPTVRIEMKNRSIRCENQNAPKVGVDRNAASNFGLAARGAPGGIVVP